MDDPFISQPDELPVRARQLVELPATPTDDSEWVLVEEGFTLAREHELESLFAIANGYVGSRGSLSEGSALSSPATFVAGAFDSSPRSVPSLVLVADWTRLSAAIDGQPLRLDHGHNFEHRRMLDMRQGILWREWRHEDEGGRITRICALRLASLADRHLLIQSVSVTPENYTGTGSIDSTLSGPLIQVTNVGTTIAMAVARRVSDTCSRRVPSLDLIEGRQGLELRMGQKYRLDRIVAVHTSEDTPAPNETAREHAERAIDQVEAAVIEHCDAWLARWEFSDLRIEGDPATQRALRFAMYHLISAANPQDERVSIGARGLSGTAYNGHVFWDTDIFMLPFFILTYPDAARALVMYRYHTLAAARAKAAGLGYRGALYAWESGDSGQDRTPPFVIAPDGEVIRILTGEQEQHISADVAFGAWNYWRWTGDDRFLIDAGVEILIETARFWASRVTRGQDGLFHIYGVIGPDEYHETVNDNAYTNGMAQWNLRTAHETVDLIAKRWPEHWELLSRRLGVEAEEQQEWQRVARDIYTGFDEQTGLFEQFRGYFDLEEIDLATFVPRSAPMDVLLGRERIRRSKIIKQPDVVMLVHLLWDRIPAKVRQANFEYYEPRCGHGSSLSPAIHALVAARLGNTQLAERYFQQAVAIDLADNMGNSAGGIHAGALGGLWQAAVFGFSGLQLTEDGPKCDPKLPDSWQSLVLRVQWRGRWHEFTLPENKGGLCDPGDVP